MREKINIKKGSNHIFIQEALFYKIWFLNLLKKLFYKGIYGHMWSGNISINTNRTRNSALGDNVKVVDIADIKFLMSGQLNPKMGLDSNVDDNSNLFDSIRTELIQTGG